MRRVRHALEPIARRVTMGGWLTCWRRCIPLTFRSHGSSVQARTGPFASLTPVASLWPSPARGSSARPAFASRAGQRSGRSPQPRGAAHSLEHRHRVPSSAPRSDRTSWPTVTARSGSTAAKGRPSPRHQRPRSRTVSEAPAPSRTVPRRFRSRFSSVSRTREKPRFRRAFRGGRYWLRTYPANGHLLSAEGGTEGGTHRQETAASSSPARRADSAPGTPS